MKPTRKLIDTYITNGTASEQLMDSGILTEMCRKIDTSDMSYNELLATYNKYRREKFGKSEYKTSFLCK